MILPGVGAARAAMDRLLTTGLDRLIPTLTQPVLGICLGMQLLFDASEEDDTRCLGVMAGSARRFVPAPDRPVPHMGWNQLHKLADAPLLDGIAEDAYCYFVHSYALPVDRSHPGYGPLRLGLRGDRRAAAISWPPSFTRNARAPPARRLLRNFLTRY